MAALAAPGLRALVVAGWLLQTCCQPLVVVWAGLVAGRAGRQPQEMLREVAAALPVTQVRHTLRISHAKH
jgi:hypothetical protein